MKDGPATSLDLGTWLLYLKFILESNYSNGYLVDINALFRARSLIYVLSLYGLVLNALVRIPGCASSF